MGDGPFAHSLDKALSSFNVERQAYYSGTFVGNHVHRCLKVKFVIDTTGKSVPLLHTQKTLIPCVTQCQM